MVNSLGIGILVAVSIGLATIAYNLKKNNDVNQDRPQTSFTTNVGGKK